MERDQDRRGCDRIPGVHPDAARERREAERVGAGLDRREVGGRAIEDGDLGAEGAPRDEQALGRGQDAPARLAGNVDRVGTTDPVP
jgi:hypothetical protein